MEQLPKWIIPNLQPTFYDSESLTTIEMTAKIYDAVRTLIEEHNKFTADIKKAIEDFESDTTKDMCCFKSAITCIVENYIKSIDHKIDTQNLVIEKAVEYMKDNIQQTATNILTALFEEGKILLDLRYDAETETLYIGGELIE